ncbi:MAG: S8 family serine peptidase, partial [Candidatus Nanopelagicales bacterium]
MTSTTNDTTTTRIRRPFALGTAAALLASVGLTGAATPAQASSAARADSPLDGVTMPVPATDVTETDADLASATAEVVVIVDGKHGPEVRKLRAKSAAEAKKLAKYLDGQPGITAAPNHVLALPATPTGSGKAKSATAVELPKAAGVRVSATPALAGEPYGEYQWGLVAVGAESAWAVTRGSGVKVAVVDTGVDASHPDLSGRTLTQINLTDDGQTRDPNGHGTHVAGIIAASLDGSGVAGLANQVSILPVRVLDAAGYGDDATVAEGIIRAADAGAKVLNLSVGGAYSPVLAESVAYAVGRGATVVAAGGNEYQDGNPTTYPAALPGVIGVSSINSGGASSWFANTGSYIDLTAPGEDILSTVPGADWSFASGTSMAAPFVAASAALVRVANPTMGKSAVDSTLTGTAVDDSSGDGRDNMFGYGLVRADKAALKAAQAPGGLRAVVSVSVAKAGYGNQLSVNVNPNQGSGCYTFTVQKRTSTGTWSTQSGSYNTEGDGETRTLTLSPGTYRVVVAGKYGYKG